MIKKWPGLLPEIKDIDSTKAFIKTLFTIVNQKPKSRGWEDTDYKRDKRNDKSKEQI